jgi:hypothetical protein
VNFALGDQVVDITLVELLGAQRVLEVVDQRRRDLVVEVLDAEDLLNLVDTFFGDGDGPLLLVHLVVRAGLQPWHDASEDAIPLGALLRGTRDDQRRAGLVDQDRVDLVDDGEVVAALGSIVWPPDHVVAQVVEAELVVGPVGDVGAVCRLPLFGTLVRLDQPDAESEEAVDAPHPFGVSTSQIVVDRDDMHALARQAIQVTRQGRDEGLTFTGAHLGDVSEVQRRATDDLDIVVTLSKRPPGSLANDRESLGSYVIEGLAVFDPFPEDICACAKFGVGQRLGLFFETVGGLHESHALFESLAFTESEELAEGACQVSFSLPS